MRIDHVRLMNFRNHAATELSFGDGVNALLGDNGEGKTNVLEAISFLCLTKSFHGVPDGAAVRFGCESFLVEGRFTSDAVLGQTVRVSCGAPGGSKEILVNGAPPDSSASVIGRFPVVVLSPEASAIIVGAPGDRRRFLDLVLAQVSRVYLDELLAYRRILKHRNRILSDARSGGAYPSQLLEPWTEALVRHGVEITMRRMAFVDEFARYVSEAYQRLVESREEPALAYAPAWIPPEVQPSARALGEALTQAIAGARLDELRRGSSQVGPHRDDLVLSMNGNDLHQFASQGQHKTMMVALKVAEFRYIMDRRSERPLFLLDDLFAELDDRRSRRILEYLADVGQTVITATSEAAFRGTPPWDGRNRRFRVAAGRVEETAP